MYKFRKGITVPEMIDLIIRLLIEKMHAKKQDEVNAAVMLLKELKGELDPEYKDISKFGKAKEDE